MTKTLEENLIEETMKRLKNRKEEIKEYICSGGITHEEYLERVGSIRAINEIEEDFTQLHKTFFPTT